MNFWNARSAKPAHLPESINSEHFWQAAQAPDSFLKTGSPSNEYYFELTYMSYIRRGTRISCEIKLTLASLDVAHAFSDPCLVILVNPQGCAARFGRPLKIGAAVELKDLPVKAKVTARVVNCISIGEYE